MIEKRYSELTEAELRQEIANLREKARRAEQLGIVNEFAVYERKALMAQAYLLDPNDYKPGEIYAIISEPGTYFKIDYLKGVFAWGYRLGAETKAREEALPISLLEVPK